MEFDLKQVRRDWIEGTSQEEFSARFQNCCETLGALTTDEVVVIRKADPIAFIGKFFAAVSLDLPIVLANPEWGSHETTQLEALLAAETPSRGSILIPTGGTTGGVKLAVHDWASLCASARGVQDFLGGEPIHSCCCLPLYHVSGLMQLIRSFISGGRIRFDDAEVAGCCLSYVPTQLQRALCDPDRTRKLGTARAIFVGGAPMSDALAQKARELKLPVIPVYGMTETAAMCAAIPNDEFLKTPEAGAVPIGDSQFSIEADGRIRIQSPALFKGYHGMQPLDLSAGYVTDDLGHIDTAGRLHVEGRADRIIISGGEKVDPAEVERVLCKLAGIHEALVVGQADEEWGQRLLAFYTSTEALNESELRTTLAKLLSKHKVPKRCIAVDVLPLDSRGKVDYKQIAELI